MKSFENAFRSPRLNWQSAKKKDNLLLCCRLFIWFYQIILHFHKLKGGNAMLFLLLQQK